VGRLEHAWAVRGSPDAIDVMLLEEFDGTRA
jgi:hypothetical protein